MNRPFKKIQQTIHEANRQADKRNELSRDVDEKTDNKPATNRKTMPASNSEEKTVSLDSMIGVDEKTLKSFVELTNQGKSIRAIKEELGITHQNAMDLRQVVLKNNIKGDTMDAYDDFKKDFLKDKESEETEEEQVEESQDPIYRVEKEVFDRIGGEDILNKQYQMKGDRDSEFFGDYIDMDFISLATADPESTPENLLKLTASAFLQQLHTFNPSSIGIDSFDESSVEVEDGVASIVGTDTLGQTVYLSVYTDTKNPYFVFERPDMNNIVRMRFEGAKPLNNLSLIMQQLGRAMITKGFQHKVPVE